GCSVLSCSGNCSKRCTPSGVVCRVNKSRTTKQPPVLTAGGFLVCLEKARSLHPVQPLRWLLLFFLTGTFFSRDHQIFTGHAHHHQHVRRHIDGGIGTHNHTDHQRQGEVVDRLTTEEIERNQHNQCRTG